MELSAHTKGIKEGEGKLAEGLEEKKVGGEAGRMRASVADDDIGLSAALGDSFYSVLHY
jgi:hypothetical protein